MNGRNRHLQYRRSVYRRRQIRLGLILTVIITVVLILGFLIVGNLLRKKNQPTENQGVTNPPPSVTEEEHSPILTLKARSVLLETADTSTFSSRVRALTENGTTALSIPLNNADGSLLYECFKHGRSGNGINLEELIFIDGVSDRKCAAVVFAFERVFGQTSHHLFGELC